METEFTEWSGSTVQVGSTVLQLGECLGEGAEGAVYRLEGTDERVVKVFQDDKREHKEPKLQQMVEDSLVSPSGDTDALWTTWPVELVTQPDGGPFLGYTMPYLDTNRYVDAQRYASKNLQWNQSTQRDRIKPALNLVMTVHWLHENGYAIGDLSEQNIRVSDGSVTLIDCDSYSIEGSDFAGKMEDPRYTPPEGRGTTHEEVVQTDLFGVTVHIFQFLIEGFHPFQAVGDDTVDGPLPEAIENGDFPYGGAVSGEVNPPPPVPAYSGLPKSIQAGFTKCFSSGLHNPRARPSLEKWVAALSKEGNFDVDWVDASGVVFERQKTDELGRNWQRDIRQGQTSQPPASRAAQANAATTGSDNETHWADNLRGNQSNPSGRQKGRGQPKGQSSSQNQSTGQSPSAQQSDGYPVTTYLFVMLVLIFILIFILIYIFTSL